MNTHEISKAIKNLEASLANPHSTYSVDDKEVIIFTSYKSTDDILKALEYFKNLQKEVDTEHELMIT